MFRKLSYHLVLFGSQFSFEVSGRFWWGFGGFHTEIDISMNTLRRVARASKLCNPPRLLCSYAVIVVSMAAFNSTTTYTDVQIANAPPLEPAFEHLLRNATVHKSVIRTLRVNSITDRKTFVKMYDSEAALEDGASDLGFDLVSGGLPHEREFARVATAWKTAKVMAETK